MTAVVIYARLEPEEVTLDDVEEFLITDDLFVEYFNAFLALPSFPTPLCFNKEKTGFEVVTDARKEIGKQIKAAIRSQKKPSKIYKVVKQHSFIDIPLIPIVEPEGPDHIEINTNYTVTTLNKEQGIHWVKERRMPAFLESDLYMEYRLSNLVSQAKITGDQGEYVLMRIDFKPKVHKQRKKAVEEEVVVDPKEQMMKEMYVCMGTASTTDTEAWFSAATMATETSVTSSCLTRPRSAEMVKRPNSARPVSAYSSVDSYRRTESGLASSIKSSNYTNYTLSSQDNEDVYSSKLFAVSGKPMTPRPTDSVCAVSEDYKDTRRRPFSATVYCVPKLDNSDNESGLDIGDDTDSVDSKEKDEEPMELAQNEGKLSSRKGSSDSIVFKNIDDIGTAIVGAVLKRTLSSLLNVDEDELPSELLEKIPGSELSRSISLEHLDKISLQEEVQLSVEDREVSRVTEESSPEEEKKNEDESDADSLLDSEEDYEECDTFFRKHKMKTYKLTNKKGIEKFKSFLSGTMGEKHWNLWLDIDKTRFMLDDQAIYRHLQEMREKYFIPGSLFELTTEQKTNLNLLKPSSWSKQHLLEIQNKIAEPLVLYWAPRFLLTQLRTTDPNRHALYQNLMHLKAKTDAYPTRPAAKLLPLRPKSCIPRFRQAPAIEEVHSAATQDAPQFLTSPPVGFRRNYSSSAFTYDKLQQSSKQSKDEKSTISPKLSVPKTTRPQISNSRSRPSTAGSSRPVSSKTSSRPISAKPASSSAPPVSPSARPVSAHPGGSRSGTTTDTSQRQSRQRPLTAGSVRSKQSDESDFIGGHRMEALLQALHHEREAGGFFKKFINRSGNKVWINCLNFWTEVQDYHWLFYTEFIDPYILQKKAKTIYSKYIVIGGLCNIGCSYNIRREIARCLQPPFEELFDTAEEYSIKELYVAWTQMITVDMKTYGKVELIEVVKHLETRSKYVLNLQKRGLIKERVMTPEDPMEKYEDPVYDPSLLDKIPDEYKDYTLEKLVGNRIELENFQVFLKENYADTDLLCWMAIRTFRNIPYTDEKARDELATSIRDRYLNQKYFFGPNSPAGKKGQEKVMAAAGGYSQLFKKRPPNEVLVEAQKYIRDRLEKKWLPLFLATSEFAERQRPKAGMDDVVDDVLVIKKKRSHNIQRTLDNNKFISSSKDVIVFRKGLLNPVTELQFRRYVSIYGDNLENDVLFWKEVQAFKELYHVHSDESLISEKVGVIISCFIDSQIPPNIQIDIPSEMAEKIVERKYERTPYLFREAQFTVFRHLYRYWEKFCQFRANHAEEKILPTIERIRKHERAKQRAEQQRLEEQALKRAEERAALGLPPEGDEDDELQDQIAHFSHHDDDEEEHGTMEKNKISWSYSNYMAALEKEDILNNTDESTFESLLNFGGEKSSENADEVSVSKQEDTESKKETKSEETQTDKKKSTKSASPESDKGGNKKNSQQKSSVEFSKMASLEEEVEAEENKKKTKSKVKGQQLLAEKKH